MAKLFTMMRFTPSSTFIKGEPIKLNVALSARNQIPGTLKEIKKGQTTSYLKIDIGGGHMVTASITNEAVDELALKSGDTVWAIIKASDVMVAK